MNRYDDLREAGRKLSPDQITDSVSTIAVDPRFAAVVALLERNKDSFAVVASSQVLARDHGSLAHAGGSIHGLLVIEGQLRQIIDPPRHSNKVARPTDAEILGD